MRTEIECRRYLENAQAEENDAKKERDWDERDRLHATVRVLKWVLEAL